MMDRKPEEVLRLAVERMLPKTTLGRKMIKNLCRCRASSCSSNACKSRYVGGV